MVDTSALISRFPGPAAWRRSLQPNTARMGAGYSGLILAVAVSSLFGLPSARARGAVNVGIAILWLVAIQSWHRSGDAETGRFWRLTAWAAAALTVSFAAAGVADFTGSSSLGSLAALPTLVSFPVLVVALASRSARHEGRNGAWSTILDVAIITFSIAGLLAPRLIVPALGHGDLRMELLASVWLLALFELAGILLVAYRTPSDRSTAGLLVLGAMVALFNVAAFAGAAAVVGTGAAPPWWITAVYGIGVLVGVEAPRFDHRLDAGARATSRLRWSLARAYMPYFAFVPLMAATITAALITPGSSLTTSLVVSMVVVSSLVACRQMLQVTENRRLVGIVSGEARRDELTGLLNRRAFDEDVAGRISRAAPFALLLADLNGLKLINDGQGGHPAGDAAIRHVARVLERVVRSGDTVYRVGGDEFSLLLGAVRGEGAQRILRSITDQLERTGRVRVAGGAASFPEDGATAAELYVRADQALYKAKGALPRPTLPAQQPLRRADDPDAILLDVLSGLPRRRVG